MKKVRIWDLPLRLFHWTLALLVAASIITQNIGGNAMQWHFLSGYAILTLLVFRLLWGLLGTRYARFSSFLYHPASVVTFLRGSRDRFATRAGHNPLGSLSVFALLAALLAQAGSGLFSNDDIASEGPLARFVSEEISGRLTWFHTEVGATVIYILVTLHLAAIAYYYMGKKENLIRPMLTGDRETEQDVPAADDSVKMRVRAFALFCLAAGAVYYLVRLFPARG